MTEQEIQELNKQRFQAEREERMRKARELGVKPGDPEYYALYGIDVKEGEIAQTEEESTPEPETGGSAGQIMAQALDTPASTEVEPEVEPVADINEELLGIINNMIADNRSEPEIAAVIEEYNNPSPEPVSDLPPVLTSRGYVPLSEATWEKGNTSAKRMSEWYESKGLPQNHGGYYDASGNLIDLSNLSEEEQRQLDQYHAGTWTPEHTIVANDKADYSAIVELEESSGISYDAFTSEEDEQGNVNVSYVDDAGETVNVDQDSDLYNAYTNADEAKARIEDRKKLDRLNKTMQYLGDATDLANPLYDFDAGTINRGATDNWERVEEVMVPQIEEMLDRIPVGPDQTKWTVEESGWGINEIVVKNPNGVRKAFKITSTLTEDLAKWMVSDEKHSDAWYEQQAALKLEVEKAFNDNPTLFGDLLEEDIDLSLEEKSIYFGEDRTQYLQEKVKEHVQGFGWFGGERLDEYSALGNQDIVDIVDNMFQVKLNQELINRAAELRDKSDAGQLQGEDLQNWLNENRAMDIATYVGDDLEMANLIEDYRYGDNTPEQKEALLVKYKELKEKMGKTYGLIDLTTGQQMFTDSEEEANRLAQQIGVQRLDINGKQSEYESLDTEELALEYERATMELNGFNNEIANIILEFDTTGTETEENVIFGPLTMEGYMRSDNAYTSDFGSISGFFNNAANYVPIGYTEDEWLATIATYRQNKIDLTEDKEALKRMHLLNEGIMDEEMTIGNQLYTTAKSLAQPFMGHYPAYNSFGLTHAERLDKLSEQYDALGFTKTPEEVSWAERSIGEQVNEGLFGSGKMILEIAGVSKIAKAVEGAVGIGRVAQWANAARYKRSINGVEKIYTASKVKSMAKTMGLSEAAFVKRYGLVDIGVGGRQLAVGYAYTTLHEGAVFEAVTQYETGEHGFLEGGAFGIVGKTTGLIAPALVRRGKLKDFNKDINLPGRANRPIRIRANTRKYFELGMQPVNFAVAMEAAEVTDALYEDMMGDEEFATFIEEHYGDYSESMRRLIVNGLIGLGLGQANSNGVLFKGFLDFKSIEGLKETRTQSKKNMDALLERIGVENVADAYELVETEVDGKKVTSFQLKKGVEIVLSNLPGLSGRKNSSALTDFEKHKEIYLEMGARIQAARVAKGYAGPNAEKYIRNDHKDIIKRNAENGIETEIEVLDPEALTNPKHPDYGKLTKAQEDFLRAGKNAEIGGLSGDGKKRVYRYNINQYTPHIKAHEVGHAEFYDRFGEDAIFAGEFWNKMNNVAEKIELDSKITEAEAAKLGLNYATVKGQYKTLAQELRLRFGDPKDFAGNKERHWEMFAHIAERIGQYSNYSNVRKSYGYESFGDILKEFGGRVGQEYDLTTEAGVVRWFRDYGQTLGKRKSPGGLFKHLDNYVEYGKKDLDAKNNKAEAESEGRTTKKEPPSRGKNINPDGSPKVSDSKVGVKRQVWEGTDLDTGDANARQRTTEYLDGSVKFEVETAPGSGEWMEIDNINLKEKGKTIEQHFAEQNNNFKKRNPGQKGSEYKQTGEVEGYETFYDAKRWNRLTDSQKKRVDKERYDREKEMDKDTYSSDPLDVGIPERRINDPKALAGSIQTYYDDNIRNAENKEDAWRSLIDPGRRSPHYDPFYPILGNKIGPALDIAVNGYNNRMKALGYGPEYQIDLADRSMSGERAQFATDLAYGDKRGLQDIFDKYEPVDNREFITRDGRLVANPRYGKPQKLQTWVVGQIRNRTQEIKGRGLDVRSDIKGEAEGQFRVDKDISDMLDYEFTGGELSVSPQGETVIDTGESLKEGIDLNTHEWNKGGTKQPINKSSVDFMRNTAKDAFRETPIEKVDHYLEVGDKMVPEIRKEIDALFDFVEGAKPSENVARGNEFIEANKQMLFETLELQSSPVLYEPSMIAKTRFRPLYKGTGVKYKTSQIPKDVLARIKNARPEIFEKVEGTPENVDKFVELATTGRDATTILKTHATLKDRIARVWGTKNYRDLVETTVDADGNVVAKTQAGKDFMQNEVPNIEGGVEKINKLNQKIAIERLRGSTPETLASDKFEKLTPFEKKYVLNSLGTPEFSGMLGEEMRSVTATDVATKKKQVQKGFANAFKNYFGNEGLNTSVRLNKKLLGDIGSQLGLKFGYMPTELVTSRQVQELAASHAMFPNTLDGIAANRGYDPIKNMNEVFTYNEIVKGQNHWRGMFKEIAKQRGIGAVELAINRTVTAGSGVGPHRSMEAALVGEATGTNRFAIFENVSQVDAMMGEIYAELRAEGFELTEFKGGEAKVEFDRLNTATKLGKYIGFEPGKKSFNDTKVEEVFDQGEIVKDMLLDVVEMTNTAHDLYLKTNGKEGVSNETVRQTMEVLFGPMHGLGKRAASLSTLPDISPAELIERFGEFNSKNWVLEHMIPAQYVKARVYDYITSYGKDKARAKRDLDLTLRDYHTTFIPKGKDTLVNQTLQRNLSKDFVPGMDPILDRYYLARHSSPFDFGLTVQHGHRAGTRYTNSPTLTPVEISRMSARLRQAWNSRLPKGTAMDYKSLEPSEMQDKIRAIDTALANGRNPKAKKQGMSTFDFDETLIIDGKNFVIATKDGKTVKISSGDWPIKGPELAEKGYEFDFSDFANVRGGKDGPLLEKMRNQINKYGPENVFVLTARQQASAEPIHNWLKSRDIDIPIENITGLGKSQGEAKAQWMLEKFAEGYNDMYFVDDALPNVEAVKDVLSKLDVKSNVQIARTLASDKIDSDFNDMIERLTGIESYKRFSGARGKMAGRGRWSRSLVVPGAQDFMGLMQNFMGKGKQGDADRAFFQKHLVDPFARATKEMNQARQTASEDLKALYKDMPKVKRKLNKRLPDSAFTHDQAIRTYLWKKAGYEIPELSAKDLKNLTEFVENDVELRAFAEALGNVGKGSWSKPGEHWIGETIVSDLFKLNSKERRADYLQEWQQNVDIIFSKENLNKIEATQGAKFREALEDTLYRMKTGSNRPTGGNRATNAWMNWINGSVGATMFLNMRSAMLQTISATNYINWKFNNPIKAALAFANQPQYWKDFTMLWNSPMLKQRRAGLEYNVQEAELAAAMTGQRNPAKAAVAWLIKKGFTPTQIADSFAICAGGASYYRNRVKDLMKKGMSKAEAENQAFLDFQETTEVSQQSSRADLISQQQASPLGRTILAWGNTPMQYMRIQEKAFRDIINGRGDFKSNASKIAYYGAIQSIIFASLQNALFGHGLDEEEDLDQEDWEKSLDRTINTVIDSQLRGFGVGGASVSAIRNAALKFLEQEEKAYDDSYFTQPDHARTMLELTSVSPVIGSKLKKLYGAGSTWNYNRDAISEMGLDIDNPAIDAGANVIEATTNLPVARINRKIDNLRGAMDSENQMWQRIAMALGYPGWALGIEDTEVQEAKERGKEARKQEQKKQREADNAVVEEENKRKQDQERRRGEEVTCAAVTRSGNRCKSKPVGGGAYCTIHQKVQQRSDGRQTRCTHIKKNGERCKMQTSNQSGKCYYHD